MKHKRYFALFLTVVLLLGLLTGCVSNMGKSTGGDPEVNKEPSDHLSGPEMGELSGAPNRKLIRTLRMDAETEDLDGLLIQLDGRITLLGGYVENREIYNGSTNSYRSRYANMTIRIPVEVMDQFVEQVAEASNVVTSTESSEDVTLSYIATQSRITALETEQTRLLELLAQAQSMDDLLMIESRLTEVRTELEEVTSQLRLYDNLVDYGTIRLYLQEVKTYTVSEAEETVWHRITTGFAKSMENLGTVLTDLLVLLITRLPYLIPAAVIALAVVLIVKLTKRKKRRSVKKTDLEKEEPNQ